AIEYHTPEELPETLPANVNDLWIQLGGAPPAKGYDFFKWAYPYTDRTQQTTLRTVTLWIYAELINYHNQKASLAKHTRAIDVWLNQKLRGLSLDQVSRIRLLASKYHKVIS